MALVPASAGAASPPLRVVDKKVASFDSRGRFYVHVRCQSSSPCQMRYLTARYRGHQITYGAAKARATIAAGKTAKVRVSRLSQWALRMLKRHGRLSVVMQPLSSLPESADQGAFSRVTLMA